MKKLMIAMAAVALAIGVQANTVNWGVNTTGGDMDSTKFASATAYLMYSSTAMTLPVGDTSKAKFTVADLTAGAELATGSMTAGAFLGSDIVTSLSGRTYFYMAVISDDGKYMAISTSTKTLTMGNNTNNSNLKWTAAQFNTYTAAPEPTSGLLMLVGLGALALRRRRA